MTAPQGPWRLVKLPRAIECAAGLETHCIRSNNFMFSNLALKKKSAVDNVSRISVAVLCRDVF